MTKRKKVIQIGIQSRIDDFCQTSIATAESTTKALSLNKVKDQQSATVIIENYSRFIGQDRSRYLEYAIQKTQPTIDRSSYW